MGAELVYALMVIIPAALLLVFLLVGLGEDLEVEADMGDVDVDVDVGDLDATAVGAPSKIGLKLILAFLIGFGLAGYVVVHYELNVPHVVAGFVGGAAAYTVVYQLLKLLYRQQGNTQVRSARLVGCTAQVTAGIMTGGVGEIRATDPTTGQSIHLPARAADPTATFGVADEVRVKSVSTGLAIVEQGDPSK